MAYLAVLAASYRAITRLHLNDICGQTKKPQDCAISCCILPTIITYACTTCASQSM